MNIVTRTKTIILCIILLASSFFSSSNIELNKTFTAIDKTKYTILDLEGNDRFEGYNLFVLERHSTIGWTIINRTMLITDLDGNIYFEKELETYGALADNAAEFINSTTILYQELGYVKLWNIETNVTQEFSFAGHHDAERNYANNTYFVLKGYVIEINGSEYLYDKIHEYSPEGSLVWEIDTIDFVNESLWCPFEDMESDWRDLTHFNSIFYDEEEDVIYLNSRNLNTFYKIDHKSGKVIWGIGEHGNFTMYDIYGNQQNIIFYHGHAVEKINDNQFILFDNDMHNQTNANNLQSRLLEITLDEEKMIANVTWQWISSSDYFSGWWGDCDLLPNNNMIGVFGTTSHIDDEIGARLVEVNRNHEIVWELSFPKVGDEVFGVYRVERVRFAPIVSTPRFIEDINSSYLEWDIWYNFRSKTNFNGTYYITVDNVTVDTGQIEFPLFWQSTQIQYVVDEITAGNHIISLVVADEAGHLSNESDRYSSSGIIYFKNIKNRALKLGLSIGIPSSVILVGAITLIILKKKNIIGKR